MKKTIFFITLITGLSFLSALSNDANLEGKSIKNPNMLQQQQTASAYRMAGGNWQRGSVNYQITQQGYKPISYDFSAYRSGGRGSFYQDSRFIPLNPNNKLAIQNNWTHMVRSSIGTLYLTLY